MRQMKMAHLILVVSVCAFLTLAITLDLGRLQQLYPDSDLTPYLTARSLAFDGDLAYTRVDSDRFFKEQLVRPSRFSLKQKKVLSSDGTLRAYSVFYSPDLYVFALIPFVRLFAFSGILLLHSLLIATAFILGYFYYRRESDSVLPAANSVLYPVLALVPILVLIPSYALFLFCTISAALFFGIRNREVVCAALIAIAASCSPWVLLYAAFFISYWQTEKEQTPFRSLRFVIALFAFSFLAWAVEQLMYPPNAVGETRWVAGVLDRPITDVWSTLPLRTVSYFSHFAPQRVLDFLVGRTEGLLIYFFVPTALLVISTWHWRDRLIRCAIVFVLAVFIAVSVSHPSSWNVNAFVSDFSILVAPLPFFLRPLVLPRYFFVGITAASAFLIGPLLLNPFGSLADRAYYLQVLPYKLFPLELSLIGRAGITADPSYRMEFEGGKLYFLDNHFYREGDFFWVKGEATVEFLMETNEKNSLTHLKIQNGSLDNDIWIHLNKWREHFRLAPADSALLELSRYASEARFVEGRYYLHGKIESRTGYTPKLLSRDNLDFRFLGCQVHLISKPATMTKEVL